MAMRFTFKREAAIMTALMVGPVLIGLLLRLFTALFGR
jgi:hypothetical protein